MQSGLRSYENLVVTGGCAVPESPKFVVGLEVHLMELKDRLLRRSNVQLIVVSGPGGCGKTTLITKLCHVEDIKGIIGFSKKIYPPSKNRISWIIFGFHLMLCQFFVYSKFSLV